VKDAPRCSDCLAIWAVLLLVPLWLPFLGRLHRTRWKGAGAGLAPMALNLLLGFTGVMSFRPHSYFGLGAYGRG